MGQSFSFLALACLIKSRQIKACCRVNQRTELPWKRERERPAVLPNLEKVEDTVLNLSKGIQADEMRSDFNLSSADFLTLASSWPSRQR